MNSKFTVILGIYNMENVVFKISLKFLGNLCYILLIKQFRDLKDLVKY